MFYHHLLNRLNCLSVLPSIDRKSTRLNSSHVEISYAVSCLKKQNGPAGDAVQQPPATAHQHRRGSQGRPARNPASAGMAGPAAGIRHPAVAVRPYSVGKEPSRHPNCFFFNPPATPEIYTLSLHDALPIYGARCERSESSRGRLSGGGRGHRHGRGAALECGGLATLNGERDDGSGDGIVVAIAHFDEWREDRKSTRLNSSHVEISYAVFCLK